MANAAARSSGANIVPVLIARVFLSIAVTAASLAAAFAQPAAPALAPIAHSALLALEATPASGGLVLRVRRANGQAPLVVDDLSVTIDGRSEPATARPDGSWFAARPAGVEDAGKTLEVTVGHDGIHEVLSGRLGPSALAGGTPPTPSGGGGFISGSHKQLFWWILNIAIVAIAAIAISRRTS